MEVGTAAFALAALGQDTRLALLRLLLAAGPSGMAAGEIAAGLGVVPSTLSFHLRALDQAGLISATRRGRQLIYAVQIERLRALIAFLSETCCGGEPDRCGSLAGSFRPDLTETAPMPAPGFTVLFLCTRNSARSIMAEALLNQLGKGRFQAFSAGSEPSPSGPMPEVISQLSALGHDVSSLSSKSWALFMEPAAPRIDFVITLCDMLSGQACPDFGATTITAAWPLPDPAKFSGNAAERASLLNELYAGLRRRIELFLSLPIPALDRMALKAHLDELAHPIRQGA
ncbi:metalloregulator ArsR/SmtB family transcription factor [Elioraea rosea]|uniref:metalloregulator ArsR/SmtB family transcription factor n=1 Tax=Elioraea rosea TaxID=2492390 RepID=UPI0011835076|nr:metalloregulator ArsR/SmtB family transcription factor [Elioraea rosea]